MTVLATPRSPVQGEQYRSSVTALASAKIAFTGTTTVHPHEEALIAKVLSALAPKSTLVVGGAFGVDTAVARIGSEGGHLIYLVAPGADYDPASNRYADVIEYCKPVTHLDGTVDKAASYRVRNQRMVALACRLVAFPATANEQRRSGTWMTIRLARATGIPIELHPLR